MSSKRQVRIKRRQKELRRYRRGRRVFAEWGVPEELWSRISPADVRVTVTEDDVAQSPVGHPALCPLCSALTRAGYKDVRVWEDGLAFKSVTGYGFTSVIRLTLPAAVRQLVIDLDRRRPLTLPFAFSLPVRPNTVWHTTPGGRVWMDEEEKDIPF